MTLISTTQAAREVGLKTWRVTDLCRRGQLTRVRQAVPDGQKRARWYCDLEELEAYLERHGRPGPKFRQVPAWDPQFTDPEPGELSGLQLQLLSQEQARHELTDLQPVAEVPGAVRVTWSDGEAFTLYPNGETDAYTYGDE